MVEYTVILVWLAFTVAGPLQAVFEDLRQVVVNNYRGYSYAMSLSTLPDFGSGPELRAYVEGLALTPEVDPVTLDRLTVDPIDEHITSALEPLTTAHAKFNDIKDMLDNLENLDDLAAEMAADAISPF